MKHSTLTPYIVIVAIIAKLVRAFLVVRFRPKFMAKEVWLGRGLVVSIGLSTSLFAITSAR